MIFQGFLIGNLLKYKYEYKGLLKYTHSVSCEIFVKFSNGKLMIDKKFQFFVKFFFVVSTHRQLITKVAFSELTQRRVIHRRNCPRSRKTLNMNVILSSFHGSSFDYFHVYCIKDTKHISRSNIIPPGWKFTGKNEFVRSFVSQNREQDGGISGTIYLQGNRGRRLLFHATGVTRFHRERKRERGWRLYDSEKKLLRLGLIHANCSTTCNLFFFIRV